jgi:thiamine biosynthesis lipoprotein
MSEKTKNNGTSESAKSVNATVKTVGIAVLFVLFGGMMLKSYLFKPEMHTTDGDTMGTKYYVIVCADSGWGWERTAMAIENELARVNQMMSTFITDSEITQFNDNPSTDWIEVSPEMVKLVKLSKEVSEIVDGKFDITVGPLVDLWGFGKKRRTLVNPPALADIVTTQLICGLDKLEYREESPGVKPALKKANPELRIDLSGVAKGYGVDCVATLLEKRGYANYMIEIGGETRTRGHKVTLQEQKGWMSMFSADKQQAPWLIGIKQPVPLELFELPVIALKANLNDRAMATSGDYFNTHEIGGRRYTHIIDPKSGEAVMPEQLGTGVEGEEIGSVSVIADTCAEADALATGFYLLGINHGIATANAHQLAVVYLIRTGDPNNPTRAVMSEAYKKNYE